MATKDPVFLELTSAVVVDGRVRTAGAQIEVPDRIARDFLRRGKAELATKPAEPIEEEPIEEEKPKGKKKPTGGGKSGSK